MRAGLSAEDWGRLGRLEPPWEALTAEQAETVAAELRRELGEGHVLHGVHLRLVTLCPGFDDVLASTPSPELPWASVHLTWSGRAESPPWPSTFLHASLEAFYAEQESPDEGT